LQLRDPDDENDSNSGFVDDEGIWEARIAAMALVNVILNCPDNLEENDAPGGVLKTGIEADSRMYFF
jgi:hypothetical protein